MRLRIQSGNGSAPARESAALLAGAAPAIGVRDADQEVGPWIDRYRQM